MIFYVNVSRWELHIWMVTFPTTQKWHFAWTNPLWVDRHPKQRLT